MFLPQPPRSTQEPPNQPPHSVNASHALIIHCASGIVLGTVAAVLLKVTFGVFEEFLHWERRGPDWAGHRRFVDMPLISFEDLVFAALGGALLGFIAGQFMWFACVFWPKTSQPPYAAALLTAGCGAILFIFFLDEHERYVRDSHNLLEFLAKSGMGMLVVSLFGLAHATVVQWRIRWSLRRSQKHSSTETRDVPMAEREPDE